MRSSVSMHFIFTFFLLLHGFYIPRILDFTLQQYTLRQERTIKTRKMLFLEAERLRSGGVHCG